MRFICHLLSRQIRFLTTRYLFAGFIALKMLEERFLAHRISYFIEWQDKSFLQRLFDRKGNKIVCTFKINKNELVRAKELSEGIEGIKFKDYGDLKDADRIRRRSEAVKSQPDPMILPALKIEEISDDE